MNSKRIKTVMVILTFSLALGLYACSSSCSNSDEVSAARGKRVYHEACAPCHGDNGDGNGPVSAYLTTKPRDFNRGVFKFRSTASGELPTDYDLFRIVNSGIYHTAMPSFAQMSIADQYSVVEYIKTLSPLFSDSTQYPLDTVKVTAPVAYTYDSIERGREVYLDMHCWSCHGITGEGNGPSAPSVTDDEGNHIQPTDLTHFWDLKVGRTPEKIYLIFSTGLNGTPMPSFSQILTDKQRWDLANYVYSLSHSDRYYDGKQISNVQQ